MNIKGRFAPSPTGDLHFGSLVAAVASFLSARSQGGRWLIRIEDIDPPREVAGSSDRILASLRRFGLRSDEPVLYQSSRRAAYRKARDHLLGAGLAYWCGCSRSELPPCGIYPGTCRDGLPPGKAPRSVRLRTSDAPIRFNDLIRGPIEENLEQTTGDFVIWRADDLPAYQLAVALDDAWQEISEVVRGFDLLDSTARQLRVLRCLELPEPVYGHHPIAASPDGTKLSKRLDSDPLQTLPREATLTRVLEFLGQPCPAGLSLADTWRWALTHWDINRVPRSGQVALEQ